jgi:hypothetical protein
MLQITYGFWPQFVCYLPCRITVNYNTPNIMHKSGLLITCQSFTGWPLVFLCAPTPHSLSSSRASAATVVHSSLNHNSQCFHFSCGTDLTQSRSATDGQPVTQGPWWDIYYFLTVTVLSSWGTLSDERKGLFLSEPLFSVISHCHNVKDIYSFTCYTF